jgi:hypothetical protein
MDLQILLGVIKSVQEGSFSTSGAKALLSDSLVSSGLSLWKEICSHAFGCSNESPSNHMPALLRASSRLAVISVHMADMDLCIEGTNPSGLPILRTWPWIWTCSLRIGHQASTDASSLNISAGNTGQLRYRWRAGRQFANAAGHALCVLLRPCRHACAHSCWLLGVWPCIGAWSHVLCVTCRTSDSIVRSYIHRGGPPVALMRA